MSIEIEGPDGAINEFPDGTPDEVISKAMRQQYGGPSGETTAPAAPAQPGALSRIGEAVSGALGRAEQAVIDTTGIGRKKGSALQSDSDLDAMIRGVPAAPVSRPARHSTGGGERREGLGAGLFGVVDQGVRGVAQGAANIAGAPMDLGAILLNATPGYGALREAAGLPRVLSNPVLGSASLKGALDTANDATIGTVNALTGANLDLPVRDGDNPVERIANRAGQELGGAALPVAGAIGKAASVGMEGARAIQSPIARYFVEQAAANPVRFAAKEFSMAGAAGLGAGGVNELSRAAGADEQSAGYVAGDLAGALAGATGFGISKAIGSSAKQVGSALLNRDKYVDQVVRDAVTDKLARAGNAPMIEIGGKDVYDTGPLASRIKESSAPAVNGPWQPGAVNADAARTPISDVIPGYRDSLADTLRDPGVAQLDFARGAAGSDAITRARASNEQAVNNALKAAAPEGVVDDLRSALHDRRAAMQDEVAQAVTAARARENAALDAVRPRMTPDVRGTQIRGSLREAQQEANAHRGAMFAGLNQGEVPIEPLADAFAQRRAGLSEAERITMDPEHLTSIPGRQVPERAPVPDAAPLPGMEGLTPDEQAMARRLLEDRPAPSAAPSAPEVAPAPATPVPTPEPPATVPLQEVTGLRSALSSEHRAALTANDTNRARVVQGYIDQIDGYLAEHHPNPEGYEAARAATRDYHDRFSRPTTDVGQVLRENQGVPVVPDERVAPRFAQPNTGNQRGLTDLLRETGADARPREAVQDQLRAQADGLRTPEAVQQFMAEHSQALDNFPALRDQLAERAGAQAGRTEREAQSTAFDRAYGTENTRGTNAVGRYLHYSVDQARQAIAGVFNHAKPAETARELFDFANRSPEAIAGMRRGLWNEIETRGRSQGSTTRSVGSQEQPWLAESASNFMNQPNVRAVLNEAYRDNPEHLAHIDQLFEVLKGANTGTRGKVANTSGTAQGVLGAIGDIISPERISSDFRSIKRGQLSVAQASTAISATIARKAVQKAQAGAIERLLDEALVNPQAAEALMRQNNPVNRAYLARNSRAWFGEQGAKIIEAMNDDGPPDPVKDALRRSQR